MVRQHAAFLDRTQRVHPGRHSERDFWVGSTQLRVIARQFMALRNRCDDCRYRLMPISVEEVRLLRQNEYDRLKAPLPRFLQLP